MMQNNAVVIAGAARTPMGALQGDLANVSAPALGSVAIKAALARANANPEWVDETIMGCVLPGGLGQAPARQASIGAGIPRSVAATTINKMCGSGMRAVMFGFDAIMAGSSELIVAGGMESMSNAPYLLPKVRVGMRLGHGELIDHMFFDGLEDAYEKGRLMGSFAEECARKYAFTREAQDAYAIASLTRAQQAIVSGAFKAEIAPVDAANGKDTKHVEIDEQPGKAKLDKIPQLRPAFAKDGTVTAANSSSISDGAAALVLSSSAGADARGLKSWARILAHSTHAHEPGWFTTAPVFAIQKLMKRLNWRDSDVDLYEINEAFAVVAMAAMHDLNLSHDKVNVRGGACALGHPIGASGARIIVTLMHALRDLGKRRGIASLCIGGGEATAVAIELI
ncbi:MAG: acetyl-CoA C-acyltransferase [Gammaproteobacteria bacterium]|nr:acetyl-CoA C-acyltransferase [Gammaproteobacteria bacterium]